MSFKKRRIFNMASDIASQEASSHREELIEQIEALREDAGLRTKHVDLLLGKPKNWYTNHKRGTGHSHDFTLTLYYTVEVLLEEYIESVDEPIEDFEDEEGLIDTPESLDFERIRSVARQRRNHAIESIEHIRSDVLESFGDIQKIERALGKTEGWYQSHRDSSEPEGDFSLMGYSELYVFSETALMFFVDEGYTPFSTVEDIVEKGYVSADVLESLEEV